LADLERQRQMNIVDDVVMTTEQNNAQRQE
jgi:hypothetical protein